MKKLCIAIALIFAISLSAQTKKNGTIYIEHPAIDAVENMVIAFVAGDVDKVGSYLADDFKAFSGTNPNPDAKGRTKEQFLNGVKFWNKNVDYFSITRSEGAYPDALEYKDSNQKDIVWVQTWEHMKGVHNETGVKIDMPIHRLFRVNKDNKIVTIIGYLDGSEYSEIGDSFDDRTNGTLYNHHENINKVRRLIRAFEFNDLEKAYSYFDEKATFRSIHMPPGVRLNLEEDKKETDEFLKSFEIESIDMVGYPDYLHYEMNDSRVVQSWWNFRLLRKSDSKKIVLRVMFMHNFNDEGMISRASIYYSAKMLEN